MKAVALFLSLSLLAFGSVEAARNSSVNALWNLNQMAECRLDYTALAQRLRMLVRSGRLLQAGGRDRRVLQEPRQMLRLRGGQGLLRRRCRGGYVDDYTWSCVKDASGKRSEPRCEEGQSKCKQYLCWCDQQVVDCWSQYPRPPLKKPCTHQPESAVKHFFNRIINGIVGFFGTVLDGIESIFRRH
ncbi:Phospholipase A2 [Aphelenchoides fujianensis]|nr:Phospholipase A2 [Aphelenchoides fujianensis]